MAGWTCFLTGRLLLGFADFITDSIQAFTLFQLGHPAWALLTLTFPVISVLAAFISVLYKSRCNNISPAKFLLLSLRELTSTCEGLFESGPELVLQLVIVLHGVHVQDMALIGDEEARWTWPWFRGVLQIFSMICSFASLLATLVYFNDDQRRHFSRGNGTGIQFAAALSVDSFSVVFRTFVASALFAVMPWAAFGIVLAAYFINLMAFCCTGQDVAMSLVTAYASLFAPSGYAKEHGANAGIVASIKNHKTKHSGKTLSTVSIKDFSEVERAKINQESLFSRIRIVHGTFAALSVLVIIPYFVIYEGVYFKNDGEELIEPLNNRLFVYLTPLLLLLFALITSLLFCAKAKQTRNAARKWFSITPARNRARTPSSVPPPGSGDRRARGRGLRSTTPRFDIEAAHADHEEDEALNSRPHSEASTIVVGGDVRPMPTAPPPYYPDYLASPPSAHSPRPLPGLVDEVAIEQRRRQLEKLQPGNSRCKSECVTCALLIEGTEFKSQMTGKSYRLMTPVSCDTKFVIYLVTCQKCKKQYVGKTEQTLRKRHYGHRREIEIKSTPLGNHFAGDCGYTNWRMQVKD